VIKARASKNTLKILPLGKFQKLDQPTIYSENLVKEFLILVSNQVSFCLCKISYLYSNKSWPHFGDLPMNIGVFLHFNLVLLSKTNVMKITKKCPKAQNSKSKNILCYKLNAQSI